MPTLVCEYHGREKKFIKITDQLFFLSDYGDMLGETRDVGKIARDETSLGQNGLININKY